MSEILPMTLTSLPRVPKAIIIGTSAGGVDALKIIFRGLPADFSVPIVVVHHLPSQMKTDIAMVYRQYTKMPVRIVEDKDTMERGFIYFAPPGYHLLIERDLSFSLDVDEPVRFSRPSIDVTFASAARALGRDMIGVLLTGANDDGARGLAEVKMKDGYTLVQNPQNADAPYMPQSALHMMEPDAIADISEVAGLLTDLCRKKES